MRAPIESFFGRVHRSRPGRRVNEDHSIEMILGNHGCRHLTLGGVDRTDLSHGVPSGEPLGHDALGRELPEIQDKER